MDELSSAKSIERHKTAKVRNDVSRPVSMAIDHGVLNPALSFFDYGCGRGGDVLRLRQLGFSSQGWDPVYAPNSQRVEADVVNIGYVVNVIEDPTERAEALQLAWRLTRRVLIVAARPEWERSTVVGRRYGDGIITNAGTFQKFFGQAQLKDWIEVVLGTKCVASAPGIFYVFRADSELQGFIASRVRFRQPSSRSPKKSEVLYESHRDLLEPLESFVCTRGRSPESWELPAADDLIQIFGSVRAALAVVRRASGSEALEAGRCAAHDDLAVYLALAAFEGRPPFGSLPRDLQLDVRAHYGTYKNACSVGDQLLYGAGRSELIGRACSESAVGKLTPEALYIHKSALSMLPPVLRVYEGCGRTLAGEIEEATLIKLNRLEPKVSYLAYPEFDKVAHPALRFSIRADLRRLDVRHRDFTNSENPPVLHRKETMVPKGYPGRDKFERLTKQEEASGLLAEPSTIGTKDGWEGRLAEMGLRLRGHRVVKMSTATRSAPRTDW